MRSLLSAIGKKAPRVLIAGVVIGLVLPGFGNLFEAALPFVVMMLLAVAMVRVDFPKVISHFRRPLRMGLILFLLMVAIPLTVHLLATLFDLSPVVHTGLVLLACAPPLAATPSMAALLELDDALVLNIMVVGTFIVPLTAPALVISILDIPINLDVGSLLVRLALTIGGALIVAVITRRIVGRHRLEANPHVLDGISALIMVAFAIVVMNGIDFAHINNPWPIAKLLGIVFLANWGLHALTGLSMIIYRRFWQDENWRLTTRDGAVALMAGNRNMALFIAALPSDIAESLFLFIALYQLPIYLTPALAAPLYRALTGRK